MINEIELRIGNFIQLKSTKEKAEVIGIFQHAKDKTWRVETKECGLNDLESFELIPLTEKWLLDLGLNSSKQFVNLEETDVFYYFCCGGFFFDNDELKPTEFYFAEAFSDNVKIKYVHQLQNIIYALSGQTATVTNK